jgi:Kef-type K+ transport system membrane component KefB
MILLQLAAILAVCRLVAAVFERLRQPSVVAQIVAGVLIGPSALGLLALWRQIVLPAQSVSVIQELGNLGLVLYMFGVGAELDLGLLRRNARSAAVISVASVLVPLGAGAAAAAWLFGDPRLFPATIGRGPAIAFFALAISITAFPVMARILTETRLASTPLGTTALAAGSFTDAAAWCLLALVTASLSGSLLGAAGTVLTGLALLLLMLVARRTPLAGVLGRSLDAWSAAPWLAPAVLLVLLVAAGVSSVAGLHPAFGAFMAGVAMPRTDALDAARRRIQPIVTSVLLPLFFVYAGLHTHVGVLLTGDLPLIALAIVLVACCSKGLACWLVARATGHSDREAVGIAALMNARGLVELIVLTIGLERGVITPTLFSIMVVMAIATTMMAGPIVRALYGDVSTREPVADAAPVAGTAPQ